MRLSQPPITPAAIAPGFHGAANGTSAASSAEVQDRVEQHRDHVQAEHREPDPDERPVQAEQRLLPLRPEQPGAHRESEPDREGQQPERDETGGARDEPGDRKRRHHAALTTMRRLRERRRAEREPARRRAGCRARRCADARRRARRRRPATRCASAVACASASAASRRDDGDRERSRLRRRAGLRVDQVVQRPAGPEAADVAARRWRRRRSRGRSTPAVAPGRRGSAMRDPPRAVLRRVPAEREVAAEIDEAAGQHRPRVVHRVERPRRRVALADAAEVDGRAGLEPDESGFVVDLDGRARPPARGASRPGAPRAARTSGRSRPRRARGARSGRSGRPVSSRARRASRSASTSRRSTAVHSPPAAFSRERSLAASKRESAASQAATSARAEARASRARRPSCGPAVTAASHIVPTARNVERSSRAVIARLPTSRSSRAWRRARPAGRRRAAACRWRP